MSSSSQLKLKDSRSRLRHLFETKELADCSFVVGKENGQLVAGHKAILSVASPVLDDKLKATTGDEPKVILTDVKPEIFQLMLKYIYLDSVDVDSNTVYDLTAAAKAYQMPYLLKGCLEYIGNNLTTKNVLQAYNIVLHTIESDELKKKCEEVIKADTKTVLSDSSFEEACPDVVVAVFSLETLDIDSELDLLNAADRYAKHVTNCDSADGDNLTVRNILEKIRFLSLTPEEFAKGRADTTVLSASDACAILANVAYEKSGVPMPSGFSLRKDPRKKVNITAIELLPGIKFIYRVPNIANMIKKNEKAWSSTFKLHNLKFKIGVQTKTHNFEKFLGIFAFSDNMLNTRSCKADVEFLLLRVYNQSPRRRKSIGFTYKADTFWGFEEFIETSELLDPINNYIEHGAITFEIHMKAYELKE